MKQTLALIIGLLIGFAAYRVIVKPASSTTTETQAARQRIASNSAPDNRRGPQFNRLLQDESQDLQSLIPRDPQAALDELLSRPITPETRLLIAGLLAELGARDPLLVNLALEKIKSPREQKLLLKELFEIWAETDTSAAIAFLQVQKKGQHRTAIIDTLVNKLIETDPEQTLRWLESDLLGIERTIATRTAFRKLADLDPEKASALLTEIQPGLLRQQAMDTIARRRAAQDIDQAFTWLKDQADGPQKEMTYRTLMQKFAAQDPRAAAAALEQLDDPKLKQRLTKTVAEKLADIDPQEAFNFTQKLSDPAAQLETQTQVIEKWATNNWREALDFATQLDDPRISGELSARAVFTAAAGRPEAAAAIITDLQDTHNLSTLANSLTYSYAEQDFTGALTWARDLSHPETKDGALLSLVEVSHSADPELSFQLATEVSNLEIRTDLIKATLLSLIQTDQEAANRALAHPSITDEIWQSLQAELPE